MNAVDLLLGLNDVQDAYITCAEEFLYGPRASGSRRGSLRKIWLIAGLVALALLLVGCAVVYALRMQHLKVGEYRFYVPTEYDENGEVIPVETHEPIIMLSAQGANLEALKEWVAFTNTYDRDGSIALEADLAAKAGTPSDIPENEWLTYGCYSREMSETLHSIAQKYGLKLLSSFISLDYYESDVLLNALGLPSLVKAGPDVTVEYWDGTFHLEGTFSLNMEISLTGSNWSWDKGHASYHYSLKAYFDPSTGSMLASRDYTQWDYTRQDGKQVLLVLGPKTARIYADFPEFFVTVGLDPVIQTQEGQVPMTREALEQLAELFDLSPEPHPTTMAQVQEYKREAQEAQDATQAKAQAEHEEQYVKGYQEFVNYMLEKALNPEGIGYVLYDVNGDGIKELIVGSTDILSMKDGTSYKYFDISETPLTFPHFRPCEGSVFEIYCEDLGLNQHYFYQAGPEAPTYLTGVSYVSSTDTWYLHPAERGDPQEISQEEAQRILSSYSPVEIRWLPLKLFGRDVPDVTYADPYAQYIADALLRFENARSFTYTRMDLNGDGVDELITREPRAGQERCSLLIHTLRNGKIALYDMGVSYICQGNILEKAEERNDVSPYYGFFCCGPEGPEMIEKIVRDPISLYWGRAKGGQEGHAIRAEEAQEVLDSYHRLELDMKPFGEYPLE